jgi:N-methylhydantoinase A
MKDEARIGVDVGGTFTDVVSLCGDGRLLTKKIPSSTDNYAAAVVDGIEELLSEGDIESKSVTQICHGTTVASNAILEGKGAQTGLITTKGFRDVLAIRDMRVPKLYDIGWQKPRPLVERYLRLEVDERVDAAGEVRRRLDAAEVEEVVERLVAENVEAIAICLLNAYANPAHEEIIEDVVRRKAPHVACCRSSAVLPEMKEYERTSTTVINAYLMPLVGRYLSHMQEDLRKRGLSAPLTLMQSSGGLIGVESAARMPMHIIESGPAGGVIGVHAFAQALGISDAISFDMGGTTAKTSMIENGELARSPDIQVGGEILIGSRLLTGAGYLLKVPAVDLAEVGAGGGSIVAIDAGGAIRVGPRSAGASPGPACYDTGGEDPTVTDANLILGYINPAYLVGGDLKLNSDKARSVFTESIAEPLGMELERAAHGVYRIAVATMTRAIRAVSTERGRDPKRCTLFAFGGNGPVFAAQVAATLGIRRILIPPSPGVFSAIGFLYADMEHHLSRTVSSLIDEVDLSGVIGAWEDLIREGKERLAADGFDVDAMTLKRSATMRYVGQTFELPVSLPDRSLDADAMSKLGEVFASEHERTYGHRAEPGHPVEIVTIRVLARGHRERKDPANLTTARSETTPTEASRSAYFGGDQGWVETPIIRRSDLKGGRTGPCIVEEYDATCVIPPGVRADLDPMGNILMELL